MPRVVLEAFPYLEPEDIRAALAHAAWHSEELAAFGANEELPLDPRERLKTNRPARWDGCAA